MHSESIDNNRVNEPDTPLNKENLTGLLKENKNVYIHNIDKSYNGKSR